MNKRLQLHCKTDETVTLAHTVRINKQEANLAAPPEKCLDLSFLDVFMAF